MENNIPLTAEQLEQKKTKLLAQLDKLEFRNQDGCVIVGCGSDKYVNISDESSYCGAQKGNFVYIFEALFGHYLCQNKLALCVGVSVSSNATWFLLDGNSTISCLVERGTYENPVPTPNFVLC